MPWTLSNVPTGVKKFPKRCQSAWVRVANKELSQGTSEGIAIATGYVAANNCKKAVK